MSTLQLRGVLTALVTPFHDGRFDEEAYARLAQRQLDGGVHGLVPCGTTGETPALDDAEWEAAIRIAVATAAGSVPVVPGTGSNNTRQSITRTQRARELGADAALVVTPYYNKPNPDGLVAHYAAIAAEGGLPLVVYNVPSRTGLNLQPEVFERIAELPQVAAIKEAAGSLGQAMSLIAGRREGVAVLSGEDELTCAMTLMGGDGVISVVSNVDPAGTVRMVNAALAGDVATATAEHYRQMPLVRALFAETNPVPAKAALAMLGVARDEVRSPLASASAATREALRLGLVTAGLL
jgi:4-hydroxy-tetrahydrodipicolinate synthase